jgi:hypothetical protein
VTHVAVQQNDNVTTVLVVLIVVVGPHRDLLVVAR